MWLLRVIPPHTRVQSEKARLARCWLVRPNLLLAQRIVYCCCSIIHSIRHLPVTLLGFLCRQDRYRSSVGGSPYLTLLVLGSGCNSSFGITACMPVQVAPQPGDFRRGHDDLLNQTPTSASATISQVQVLTIETSTINNAQDRRAHGGTTEQPTRIG